MTIDEAIKHEEEVAKRYERMEESHDDKLKEECLQRATDHRQLAEWLTELKELREENITLKNDNERLRDCVDSCVHNSELDYAELEEAKRLLEAAVAVLNDGSSIKKCEDCNTSCTRNCRFKWKFTDEALKLIGGKYKGEYTREK